MYLYLENGRGNIKYWKPLMKRHSITHTNDTYFPPKRPDISWAALVVWPTIFITLHPTFILHTTHKLHIHHACLTKIINKRPRGLYALLCHLEIGTDRNKLGLCLTAM